MITNTPGCKNSKPISLCECTANQLYRAEKKQDRKIAKAFLLLSNTKQQRTLSNKLDFTSAYTFTLNHSGFTGEMFFLI